MPQEKKTASASSRTTKNDSAPATITLKQIAAQLAESQDVPKKQAEATLNGLVMLATEHLKKGDKIRLTGLGMLEVRSRPARSGRNPGTGAPIEIAASK